MGGGATGLRFLLRNTTMRLCVTLLAVALISVLVEAQTIPEDQLILSLRAAEQNCLGATSSVQQAVTRKTFQSVYGRSLQIASAVIESFSEREPQVQVGYSTIKNCDGQGGVFIFIDAESTTETFKLLAVTQQEYDQEWRQRNTQWNQNMARVCSGRCKSMEELAMERAIANKRKELITVRFTKSYQDRSVTYMGWIRKSDPLVSSLRVGQKVSLSLAIAAVFPSAVSGMIQSITPETRVLQCANGHEYAPSSGYRFCPIDGLPVR